MAFKFLRFASPAFVFALSLSTTTVHAADVPLTSLEGTWVMTSAYEIHDDGTRTTNYGEHPNGLLMVDKEGNYSLQIFRVNRTKFASADKTRGTPEEYRDAVLGASTLIGHVVLDSAGNKLTFNIDAASYPNWDNTKQVRDFAYKDGVLTYSVPKNASGNGVQAFSVWKHVSP